MYERRERKHRYSLFVLFHNVLLLCFILVDNFFELGEHL